MKYILKQLIYKGFMLFFMIFCKYFYVKTCIYSITVLQHLWSIKESYIAIYIIKAFKLMTTLLY